MALVHVLQVKLGTNVVCAFTCGLYSTMYNNTNVSSMYMTVKSAVAKQAYRQLKSLITNSIKTFYTMNLEIENILLQ